MLYGSKICAIVSEVPLITTLRQLLTNVKDKDEPNNRQGAVYKIKCCDCQASQIGETGRSLNIRLTEHKWATSTIKLLNAIYNESQLTGTLLNALLTVQTTTNDSTLESWFTNLEQTPLDRCQQLPAAYKRLVN